MIHTQYIKITWFSIYNILCNKTFNITNGPGREITCLLRFANNTSPDQPAHPASLISAFVICFLKSIIRNLFNRLNFNFLASLCSCGDWYESPFFGNPEDRFSREEAQMYQPMWYRNYHTRKSVLKCACPAIQWGYVSSWSKHSSTSIYSLYVQAVKSLMRLHCL